MAVLIQEPGWLYAEVILSTLEQAMLVRGTREKGTSPFLLDA